MERSPERYPYIMKHSQPATNPFCKPVLLCLLWLLTHSLAGQLRGPDVSFAAGTLIPSQNQRGLGPAATLSINHGYRVFAPVYVRIGLGFGYKNFVVNDSEQLPAGGEAALQARRFELQQIHGRATGLVGAEVGRWSVELGVVYEQPLWLDNEFTTATYAADGGVVTPIFTADLRNRKYVPYKYLGDYYMLKNHDWFTTAAINTRLSQRLAVGIRFQRSLGRPMLVHSDDYIPQPGDVNPPVEVFTREIPLGLDMVTLSLRYRLSSE